jgi:hypothetical protein
LAHGSDPRAGYLNPQHKENPWHCQRWTKN